MATASAPNVAAADRRLQQGLENLLAEVHKAVRAVNFYPPGHPILNKIHETSYEFVAKAAKYFGELSLEIGRNQVTYGETVIGQHSDIVRSLCQHLYRRRTKRLIVLAGVSMDEFRTFAEAAALDPEELYLRGGMEGVLADHGVRHLWANEMNFERLRRRGEDGAEEEQPNPMQEALNAIDLNQEAPDSSGVFNDTDSLGEGSIDLTPQSEQHEALARILPLLDQTTDTEQYFEGVRLVVELAQHFVREHDWVSLVKIVSNLQVHSSDPARGVEFKKYSYRALRTIGTPEVVRGLLTELVTDGRNDEEIDSLLRILAILGPAATDVVIKRIGYFRTPYQRNLIEQALYRAGAGEKLIPLLSSEDPDIVALVLRVLGRSKPEGAVAHIAALTRAGGEMIRSEAVRALLKIRNAEALNALYDLLPPGNDEVRGHIIRAFGLYREVRAISVLFNMLTLEKDFALNSELRASVFRTLGRIGGPEVCQGLLEFVTAKRLWRPKYDDEFVGASLVALGEAADAKTLGELVNLQFKSEKLQTAQVNAVRRAQSRLQAGAAG